MCLQPSVGLTLARWSKVASLICLMVGAGCHIGSLSIQALILKEGLACMSLHSELRAPRESKRKLQGLLTNLYNVTSAIFNWPNKSLGQLRFSETGNRLLLMGVSAK